MKSQLALALSIAAALPIQAGADPTDLSSSVQIEPITTISTQELWSTAASTSVESGVVIVEKLDIDPETALLRGTISDVELGSIDY